MRLGAGARVPVTGPDDRDALPPVETGPLVTSRAHVSRSEGAGALRAAPGTRLRPITHTSAKQLVPVANTPVLFYGLRSLRDAGVREVGIIVGDTQAEIEAAVGDGAAFGLEVTYLRQEAPLGLAHAVLTAEAFLGDASFVMYLGDNLLRDGITELVDEFRRSRPDAMILLQRVPNPQAYGVAELEDGRVRRLEEKPAGPGQRPGPGRRLHVHARDPGLGQGHPPVGARASSRSPTPSST